MFKASLIPLIKSLLDITIFSIVPIAASMRIKVERWDTRIIDPIMASINVGSPPKRVAPSGRSWNASCVKWWLIKEEKHQHHGVQCGH